MGFQQMDVAFGIKIQTELNFVSQVDNFKMMT